MISLCFEKLIDHICLFRDAWTCIELGLDVAYFNQLKVKSCLLYGIGRRGLNKGFLFEPRKGLASVCAVVI